MRETYDTPEENLEIVSLRIFPQTLKEISQILKADKDELFENRSHFIRCAINYFKRSQRIKNLLEEETNGKYKTKTKAKKNKKNKR